MGAGNKQVPISYHPTKLTRRHKEGHFVLIKKTTKILNMYTPSTDPPSVIKHTTGIKRHGVTPTL